MLCSPPNPGPVLYLERAEDEHLLCNDPEHANRTLLTWDGYIDPNGAFHGTRPGSIMYYLGSHNLHEDWADVYLKDEVVKSGRAKDTLVDKHGWVSMTFYMCGRPLRMAESILGLPLKPTAAQIAMLEHIWRVRALSLNSLKKALKDNELYGEARRQDG